MASRLASTILFGILVLFVATACQDETSKTANDANTDIAYKDSVSNTVDEAGTDVPVLVDGRDATLGDAGTANGSGWSIGWDGSGAGVAEQLDGMVRDTGFMDTGIETDGWRPEGSSGDSGAMVDAGPLFPPHNGKNLCPDPSLRIRFSGPPRVGNSGLIQVFNSSSSNRPVATINLAEMFITETIGGTTFNLPRPVYVNGNEVIVRLPPQSLGYGQTYYVTLDSGAVLGPDGQSMIINAREDWQFTTRPAPPDDLNELRVAVDGTGQFCSVQGALDALPNGNNVPSTITIGKGTYFEIIRFSSKNNIALRGEDRKETIIAGVNNNNLNPSTATRSLVGIDRSSDIIIENLTIHNFTPQDGSQAEALRMQYCDRCVVRHADIKSLQDTLLWSGRIYANDCIIDGNVDFVWGTGVAFFDNCEIKTIGRRGYIVQARNPTTSYGYVFVDSKLTADPGITGQILARINASVYPGSHVAFINCQMSGIAPEGWSITGLSLGGALRFWEYQSTDPSGAPIDVSRRLPNSRQISADEAARMRDPTHVLGGWTPPM